MEGNQGTPYRKRVKTVHRGSGYSHVVLARKRTVPDYVKCPHNSTCRINLLKLPVSELNASKLTLLLVEAMLAFRVPKLGFVQGPERAMVGLKTEAILLALGTVIGTTRKRNSPTFTSRTTGPTGQCIGDLCLRLKVDPGGGCERQHNVG